MFNTNGYIIHIISQPLNKVRSQSIKKVVYLSLLYGLAGGFLLVVGEPVRASTMAPLTDKDMLNTGYISRNTQLTS